MFDGFARGIFLKYKEFGDDQEGKSPICVCA